MLYQISKKIQYDMKKYDIVLEKGRHQVCLSATSCGEDWNVVIVGGEKYHIGAVAMGIPSFIDGDTKRPMVTVNSSSVMGHKDDELARKVVIDLVKEFSKIVVVTMGIHVDHATEEDISILSNNTLEVCKRLAEQVKHEAIGDYEL